MPPWEAFEGSSRVDASGYFGRVTSTMDWCEENYAVLPYMAEFWNTVSNLSMIVPPLVGAYYWTKDNLELRVLGMFLGLLSVGIGSWLFHMTLIYSMQLMDELPMLWGTSALVYSMIEFDKPEGTHNRPLQLFIFFYCLIVTIVYVVVNIPIFHQVMYGLMVLCIAVSATRIVRNYKCSKFLFFSSFFLYNLGFLAWNLDNHMCAHLRDARLRMPVSVVRPLTQLHAWWHLLAGLGTYQTLMFYVQARSNFLKRPIKMVSCCRGWLPLVVRVTAPARHD